MTDDSVIVALEAALVGDPGNVSVRRHLARLLLDSARPADALSHATMVLGAVPDDLECLELAGECCERIGDTARAESYRRMAQALGGSTGQPEPPSVSSTPVRPIPSTGESSPDNPDELMAMWESGPPAPSEPEIGELSAPAITLANVGGLDDVKARLDRSLFAPLRNPDLAAAFGASVRGGLVLYGPPGCGKTYLARAVAGELGARFYSVGISDILDMWMGNSERNVSAMFDVARAHQPCVLFLDEIDALGMRRTALRNNPSMRTVVNQLLAELDGVSSDNRGVFVLAATNHPWDIDPALLRPGRLGHLVLVTPPDNAARAHIVWNLLQDRPTTDLDVWAVAARSEGFSGADLREVCDRAVEAAMHASLSAGVVVPVTTADLLTALSTVRPSTGGWIDTARNVALYANTDGQYDDLAAWLRSIRRG